MISVVTDPVHVMKLIGNEDVYSPLFLAYIKVSDLWCLVSIVWHNFS